MGTSTTSQLPVAHRSGALTVMRRMFDEGFATGPFFGPPSGRPVDITVVDIARIVEHWGVPDRFALLAQTGILNRLS